jgi:hypothetical protein
VSGVRPGRARTWLALAGGGLAVVVLAALLLGPCATPTPAPPPVVTAPGPAPPPAAPAPVELVVSAVRGSVERGGLAGDWRPLVTGDRVKADEQVRTGPRSSVDFSAGDRAQLSVGERTQLAVRELTDVHRYRLTKGLVNADYSSDSHRLRIEGEGENAPVIEARAARVHVSASGLAFAVATETGGVTLASGGASVALGANQAARARTGEAPDQPRAIPTSVLLKVAEASRSGARRGCLDSFGEADPTAMVTVDGESVPVGPEGRFPIRVLQEGRRSVVVRAVLPDGRVNERSVPCRTDPDARIEDLRMRWKNGGR